MTQGDKTLSDVQSPPNVLRRFALYAFGGLIVLMLLWVKASPWLSYPVAVLSHTVLEQTAPMWVGAVHKQPGSISLDTTVEVVVPNTGGRRAEVTVDADPGRYAFGLPIFTALLLAAWGVRRISGVWQRALLGYLLLLPFQCFSLVFYLLMQLAGAAQFNIRTLRIDQWQLEAIIYGYQVGALVLPTLVPVLVWLLIDRRFFTDVIVHGWQRALASQPQ